MSSPWRQLSVRRLDHLPVNSASGERRSPNKRLPPLAGADAHGKINGCRRAVRLWDWDQSAVQVVGAPYDCNLGGYHAFSVGERLPPA